MIGCDIAPIRELATEFLKSASRSRFEVSSTRPSKRSYEPVARRYLKACKSWITRPVSREDSLVASNEYFRTTKPVTRVTAIITTPIATQTRLRRQSKNEAIRNSTPALSAGESDFTYDRNPHAAR